MAVGGNPQPIQMNEKQ